MDNCCGQNKNNMFIRFGMYLFEMKIYKEVEFVFLIPVHTKNACDRMFNTLKINYHKEQVYTMNQLEQCHNFSDYIICKIAKDEDFLSWDNFENNIYKIIPISFSNQYYFMINNNNPTLLNISELSPKNQEMAEYNDSLCYEPNALQLSYKSFDLIKK